RDVTVLSTNFRLQSSAGPEMRCSLRLKAWSFHNPRRRYKGSKGSTMGGTKKGMSVLDLFAGLGLCESHIESKSGNNRLPSIIFRQSSILNRTPKIDDLLFGDAIKDILFTFLIECRDWIESHIIFLGGQTLG